MRKLIEEGVDPLAQLRPVVGEAMAPEHVAAQPAPQLLDGSEPESVGRQPDRLQARQLAQGRQHVVVVMDRPVVLYHIEALGGWIHLVELAVEGADLRATDQLVVQGVHLARERTRGADEALLAGGGPGRGRPAGPPPRPRPPPRRRPPPPAR